MGIRTILAVGVMGAVGALAWNPSSASCAGGAFEGANASGVGGIVRAAAAPQRAAASRPAWFFTSAGEAMVQDAGGLGLVLEVGCSPDEGDPFVAFGIPNGAGSISTSGLLTGDSDFARRFRGFSGATLSALDGSGRVIGAVTIPGESAPDGSGIVWLGIEVDRAVFAAIQRATSLKLVSDEWTATFSGEGAHAAIQRTSCQDWTR